MRFDIKNLKKDIISNSISQCLNNYVNENINTWIDNDDVKILHFYRADKN